MIGRKIISKESLDSTSNYIAKMIESDDIVDGTVIMADYQTNGRGQRGAEWVSEPYKNLIFSCYVKHDNLSVNDQVAINQFVSLALVDVLDSLGISSSIKWPNDILVGNLKISGILIENQLSNQRIQSSIIGIGLNVNQMGLSSFLATSILEQTKKEHQVGSIAFRLIEALNNRFDLLKQGQFDRLKSEYLKRLWLFQTWTEFILNENEFTGKIINIDEFGRLVVENEAGESTHFSLKEIQFKLRNAF